MRAAADACLASAVSTSMGKVNQQPCAPTPTPPFFALNELCRKVLTHNTCEVLKTKWTECLDLCGTSLLFSHAVVF